MTINLPEEMSRRILNQCTDKGTNRSRYFRLIATALPPDLADKVTKFAIKSDQKVDDWLKEAITQKAANDERARRDVQTS